MFPRWLRSYLWGTGSRTPLDNKMHGRSSRLYKMVQYLHITYTHPPVYFKPSPDYLHLIQCKCYVNSCWCTANSSFAFWNFLDIFKKKYFQSSVGWICGCRTHGQMYFNFLLCKESSSFKSSFSLACWFLKHMPARWSNHGWMDGCWTRVSCGILGKALILFQLQFPHL